MDWILSTETHVKWMLWLRGAAGAGKSAIARSIVALCLAKKIPIARFFFFRTDPTRNTILPVVATLVHQLIEQIPDLLTIIIPKIQSDNLIFTKSLETQLQYLIFEPLQQLHKENCLTTVVLLFDGVDECGGNVNQTLLVQLIADFFTKKNLPVISFFGSRPEYQLQEIFQENKVSTILQQLVLDDHYLPDIDIRMFLNDKFTQIKNTHSLKHLLGKDWPLPEHVEEIVLKSSGQFVYASVVINFVSSSRKHPGQHLDIIRGLRPPGNSTPFAQLDELYRHIFSQVQDLGRTSILLACAIWSTHNFWRTFGYNNIHSDAPVLLADLASVLVYEDNRIRFLHASLPDFLLDQTRSQGYYLDRQYWSTCLSIQCFSSLSALHGNAFAPLVEDFLPHSEGTPALFMHVQNTNLDTLNFRLVAQYLRVIKTLNFRDHGALLRRQLDRVTRYIIENQNHQYKFVATNTELILRELSEEILGKTENENAAKLAFNLTNNTDQVSPTIDSRYISRSIVEYVREVSSVTDSKMTGRGTGAKEKKRAADDDYEVESSHRQSYMRGPQHAQQRRREAYKK